MRDDILWDTWDVAAYGGHPQEDEKSSSGSNQGGFILLSAIARDLKDCFKSGPLHTHTANHPDQTMLA